MTGAPDRRFLPRVIDWSIAHRGAVLVSTLLLSIAGLWAVRRTPVDAIPDLSDVQVIVMTEWPGQAPQLGGAGTPHALRAAVRRTVAGGATGIVPVATPAARRLRGSCGAPKPGEQLCLAV